MIEEIQRQIEESITTKRTIPAAELATAVDLVVDAYRGGNKVLLAGNGGSAADAQHLAAEMVGRYLRERDPLPAIALHTNTSSVTAIGNDYGYDIIFVRQLEAFAKPGDVFVGISTSGNSKNVILALEKARAMGVKTIGFTGRDGGAMKDLCDVHLNVPSPDTPRIQECHITMGHILCDLVEQRLMGQ